MKKPLRIVSIGLALLLWAGMFTLPAFAEGEATPSPSRLKHLHPTPLPHRSLRFPRKTITVLPREIQKKARPPKGMFMSPKQWLRRRRAVK